MCALKRSVVKNDKLANKILPVTNSVTTGKSISKEIANSHTIPGEVDDKGIKE